MIEKILVAVAGRGLCEEMFNMLMEVPSLQNVSVTVLHVVPNETSADDMAEKLEQGGKYLAQAVQSLKIDPNRVNPRLKQGDPKTVVLEVAEEENADLIIMGSRALGRLQAILENSVSQYVFQLSSLPMLLVKDDVYVKRLKRLVVAVDSSAASKDALEMAIFLARDLQGCQLDFIRVNSPENVSHPEQESALAAAAAEAKKYGIKYHCQLTSGNAGEEICKAASNANADLLLLGSPDRRPSVAKGLPDLDRLLGNSVSDYVRVKAECPVLLTRTPGQ
ncbi:universal stress protein [Geitlerinema sp. PCC 9228]|jgi:nucleotide-binding universal stress UspA family protein|uniref:universal stress protein n=1 Tax=Geitlerinema sp. PCC 9228 TaxID=111611 RepID=UPI0008F9A94E|nr:universal stress protein [Geitlerinema sp. PCC 9228]